MPARIRRLTLTNFRNYHAATLEADLRPIVLYRAERRRQDQFDRGDLVPRAGPRSAPRHARGGGVPRGRRLLGGGRRGRRRAGARHARHRHRAGARRRRAGARNCRIDREPVASAAAFADHLRVVWLVPAMDSLFVGAPSERRRFLDRLALAVDAEHASRVNALERALRSRNRLLEEAAARSALARRRRARDRGTCRRGGRMRAEAVHRLDGGAGGPAGLGLSAGGDCARRLDGEAPAGASRDRNRGALPRGAARQPRPRRRRRAHARRPASDRPFGGLRGRRASPPPKRRPANRRRC